jgi:hypothetical protein
MFACTCESWPPCNPEIGAVDVARRRHPGLVCVLVLFVCTRPCALHCSYRPAAVLPQLPALLSRPVCAFRYVCSAFSPRVRVPVCLAARGCGWAQALGNLATAHAARGCLPVAQTLFATALAMLRRLRMGLDGGGDADTAHEARVRAGLGAVLQAAGDARNALHMLEVCLCVCGSVTVSRGRLFTCVD